jgi:anaerobic selenocysteine-containing dehydrogenase
MFGRQYLHGAPDVAETDLFLILGWNGMQSHQIPEAPRHLQRIAKDPSNLLIVIDPRLSETAKIADRHLSIRPGTDALLLRAMIAIILQEGWEKKDYIADRTSGFEIAKSLFMDFDAYRRPFR